LIIELLIYVAAGAVAGVLAGLLGIGGGLILVPILSSVFLIYLDTDYIVHIAIATSLATILMTSIGSVVSHHRHGAVQWPVISMMLIGVSLGGFFGGWTAQFFTTSVLAIMFALLEITVATQMLLGKQPAPHRNLPGRWGLNASGSVIGWLSSLLGVGGGSMLTPYFVWHNVSIRYAIATSSALAWPIALMGTLAYLLAGWSVANLPDHTLGFIYWPALLAIASSSLVSAYFGAKLTHRVPVKFLRQAFAIILLLLGIKMLFF
jgi:uncharacterized membrane protein YfcA